MTGGAVSATGGAVSLSMAIGAGVGAPIVVPGTVGGGVVSSALMGRHCALSGRQRHSNDDRTHGAGRCVCDKEREDVILAIS